MMERDTVEEAVCEPSVTLNSSLPTPSIRLTKDEVLPLATMLYVPDCASPAVVIRTIGAVADSSAAPSPLWDMSVTMLPDCALIAPWPPSAVILMAPLVEVAVTWSLAVWALAVPSVMVMAASVVVAVTLAWLTYEAMFRLMMPLEVAFRFSVGKSVANWLPVLRLSPAMPVKTRFSILAMLPKSLSLSVIP